MRDWRWGTCLLVCALLVCGVAASAARAEPASLDGGFGTGGTVFTSIGAGEDAQAAGVAPTSDGGEVAAGEAIGTGHAREVGLARYTSNGALNSGFGSGGVVLAQLGGTGSEASAVAVLGNGDVAIAGEAEPKSGENEVLVALYSSTGSLVTSFHSGSGPAGTAEFTEGDDKNAAATAIAVAPSGELYVAGHAGEGSDTEMFVAQVNASTGALAQSSLIAAGKGVFAAANAIAVSGSDVIVAGEAEEKSAKDLVLAERTTAGATVSGFGTSGTVLESVGEADAIADGIAVSGGQIVVSGSAVHEGTNALLAAFNLSTGALETGFGHGGIAEVPVGSLGESTATAITVDAAGNFLIAGHAGETIGGMEAILPFVARLTSSGALDPSFSPSSPQPGTALLDNGDSDGEYKGVFVQSNGEIVAAGADGPNNNKQDFLLARYLGPVDQSSGGQTTAPAPAPNSSGSSTPPATCVTTVKTFGVLQVRACFLTQGTRIIATGDIDADGLSIVPSSCTALVFDPVAGTIQSACNQGGEGEVAISLGGIPLYRGAVAWSIPKSSGELVGNLEAGAFSDLKGFAIIGQINLEAVNGGIDVVVHTELPAPFDVVHGEATLRADLEHGLELSSLEITDDELWLGPVEVKNLFVKYEASDETWEGGAEAELPEPLGTAIKASAAFEHGNFKFFEAKVKQLNIAVGPSVFLQEIGFAADAKPFGLEGNVGLSIGPDIGGSNAIGLNGRFVLIVPSPGWDVRVEGKASVVEVPLANGYLEIDSKGGPPDIFFGGGVDFNVDGCSLFCVKAGIEGWVDIGKGTFDAYASAELGVLGYTTSLGEVDVSSKAISGCANISLLVADVSVGGAYEWGGGFHPLGDVSLGPGGASCDLSPYRPTAPEMVIGSKELKELQGEGLDLRAPGADLASTALATPGQSVTLPSGQRGVMWRVIGNGGVPQLTVTEPGGQQLASSPTGAPVKGPNDLILEDPANDSTYVLIGKPSAGRWTFIPTGSVAISSIQTSAVLPSPQLSAHVSGHGRARVLHYKIAPVAGQTVRFLEKGGKLVTPLATVSGAHGTLHFTPAYGPGGTRQIVAQVLEGETVRKQMVVASYVAPPPPPIGRPTHVKLSRRGSNLLVSWHAAAGAKRYLLTAHETDGADLLRSVRGTHATLEGLAGTGATVSVAVQTPANVTGPAATAKLARVTAPRLRHPPAIHGRAEVGQTLTCTTGTWSGAPTRYVTEWLAKGITIAGATHRSLRLTASELDASITCEVTARNAEGFASSTSKAVRVSAARKAGRPKKR
jgi:uncharacterized delta-60 repeat protein